MNSIDYYNKLKCIHRIEILTEFLDQLNDLELEDESIKDLVKDKIDSENDDFKKLDNKKLKKDKTKVPRKLSAYNLFVKQQLPQIKNDFPELENKQRMSKASELWKKLSKEEKDKYKVVEKESIKNETIEVLDEEELVLPISKKTSKKSKK